MKVVFGLLIFSSVISSYQSFAETSSTESVRIIEEVVGSALREIEPAPEIYPHFFVYGLEVEASAGVSDIAEIGSSLGIELHFERRTN